MTVTKDFEHVYKFPWEVIIEHYWRRYQTVPTEEAPDCVSVEYCNGKWDKLMKTIAFERKAQVEIRAPNWIKKLARLKTMTFITHVRICRRSRTMECRTKNLTFADKISMDELCVYRSDPENSEWTLFSTKASLNVVYIPGVSSACEKVIMNNYSRATAVARELERPFIQNLASSVKEPMDNLEDKILEKTKPEGYDPLQSYSHNVVLNA